MIFTFKITPRARRFVRLMGSIKGVIFVNRNENFFLHHCFNGSIGMEQSHVTDLSKGWDELILISLIGLRFAFIMMYIGKESFGLIRLSFL